MDKNTGTAGAIRPHIDTLRVRPGFAFLVSPVETRAPIATPRTAPAPLPALTVDDAGWWAA